MIGYDGRGALIVGKEQEADFFIHYLYEYEIGGQKLYLTTTHVSLLILSIGIIGFALIGKYRMAHAREIPGFFQNSLEWMVESLDGMVKNIMGENGKAFADYISAIFLFLVICNISGLIGLRPPTADYGVTLPLGIITFALIQINGWKKKKHRHITGLFEPIPLLFPINLIGELSVPLSLSLRLFGNVLSGTVMLGLLYGLTPVLTQIGLPAFAHVYFDLFSGAIQTYVFCMLTMVYIKEKME